MSADNLDRLLEADETIRRVEEAVWRSLRTDLERLIAARDILAKYTAKYELRPRWTCAGCGMPQKGIHKGICDPCKAVETADPNSEGRDGD